MCGARHLDVLSGKGPSTLDVPHDGLDHLRGGALPPNVRSVQLQRPSEAIVNLNILHCRPHV